MQLQKRQEASSLQNHFLTENLPSFSSLKSSCRCTAGSIFSSVTENLSLQRWLQFLKLKGKDKSCHCKDDFFFFFNLKSKVVKCKNASSLSSFKSKVENSKQVCRSKRATLQRGNFAAANASTWPRPHTTGNCPQHTPSIAFRHLPPNSEHRFSARASLSGTSLQTLPDLVTPQKGQSLFPRSCPAMLSSPSERFGH